MKGQTKNTPSKDPKYKRPPPRPPGLGSGAGMGLLFSSASLPHTSSVTPAAERKEEGRGEGGGDKQERKSVSTSPPPSRPPVPPQSRAVPPVPPAPLRRTSSRKSSDREVGEGTEREKGQNPAKKTEKEQGGERGEEETEKSSVLVEIVDQENSIQNQEENGVKKDGEKSGKENENKEVTMDKEISSTQCPQLLKKPSRPVPPPRRKPADTPLHPNQAEGGLTDQNAGMRGPPPPSPARRPDVSLYSPQGGAVLGTDVDSCSTSSTEEEPESNQEQERNHK